MVCRLSSYLDCANFPHQDHQWCIRGCKQILRNSLAHGIEELAQYFTTGVRTGPNELSMLLIPRQEGVETKPVKTSYC